MGPRVPYDGPAPDRAAGGDRGRRAAAIRQGVGLAFALVGLVGYLLGATVLGAVAVGLALVAALLNAVFGFCLGCEMYLLIRRLAPAAA